MISNMSFIERIFYILQKYGTSYLKGAGTTLVIALVSTFIGCIIGFLSGIIQTIPVDKRRDPLVKRVLLGIVNVILRIYIEVFRGTPMIRLFSFITDWHRYAMCSLACGRQHSLLYRSTPEPIWQSQSEAVSFR